MTTENWVASSSASAAAHVAGARRAAVPACLRRPLLPEHELELRDPDGLVSATSTNYDDTGFAYGGGGGLLLPVGRGRGRPRSRCVRYVRTGSVRFLAEGDLGPDGAVGVPHQGQANVFEFRLGLAFSERTRPPRR